MIQHAFESKKSPLWLHLTQCLQILGSPGRTTTGTGSHRVPDSRGENVNIFIITWFSIRFMLTLYYSDTAQIFGTMNMSPKLQLRQFLLQESHNFRTQYGRILSHPSICWLMLEMASEIGIIWSLKLGANGWCFKLVKWYFLSFTCLS